MRGWSDAVYARRDCALLLIGFAAALRRSELVSLGGADAALHALDGMHLTVRQSKTDQEGAGSVHAIPARSWLTDAHRARSSGGPRSYQLSTVTAAGA